jgi:hypothetical protein
LLGNSPEYVILLDFAGFLVILSADPLSQYFDLAAPDWSEVGGYLFRVIMDPKVGGEHSLDCFRHYLLLLARMHLSPPRVAY